MLHRAHTPRPQENGHGFLPTRETDDVYITRRASLIPRPHFGLGNEAREVERNRNVLIGSFCYVTA